MKKVLVLGGGIGGTECAVALRKEGFEVTLVSERPYLYAYPASIWVPTGEVKEEEVKLDLKEFSKRWGIELVEGKVSRIKEWEVQLEDGRSFKDFDYAVIAVGQVKKEEEGLEHTLSPCGSPEEILTIKRRLEELIEKGGGKIAFGFGGNPKDKTSVRGGPLFEVLFNVDDHLRRLGVRERFELSFFCPMQSPGERLGEKAVKLLQETFKKLGVKSYTGRKIKAFTEKGVLFEGDHLLEADLVIYVPAGWGPPLLKESGLPVNEAGFVRIGDDCKVVNSEKLYAVGDCAAVEGPPWMAKQGHLAEVMGRAVAHNIAIREGLRKGPVESYREHLHIVCLMDMGRKGAGFAYRDDKKALFIPLPFVGHWIKRLWLPYFKLTKMGKIPKVI